MIDLEMGEGNQRTSGPQARLWPPSAEADPNHVTEMLAERIRIRSDMKWRALRCELRGGRWLAIVEMSVPNDDHDAVEIAPAASPLEIEFHASSGNPRSDPHRSGELSHNARTWASWALEQWSDFPVERVPRPIILVGPSVYVQGGFRTGEAKLAFTLGNIEAKTRLPADVLHMLTRNRPRRSSTLLHPSPLRVTHSTRGEAEFLTDKGPRMLPAWRLDSREAIGSIWILDPQIDEYCWRRPEFPTRERPLPGAPRRSLRSWIEPDDRTMHYCFVGSPDLPRVSKHAETLETKCAIAVIPKEAVYLPAGPRTAAGIPREVIVTLKQPLEARVLVDLDATPVECNR